MILNIHPPNQELILQIQEFVTQCHKKKRGKEFDNWKGKINFINSKKN
jgi:hypothetical protein